MPSAKAEFIQTKMAAIAEETKTVLTLRPADGPSTVSRIVDLKGTQDGVEMAECLLMGQLLNP